MNKPEIIEKLNNIVKPFMKINRAISNNDNLVLDLGFESIDIIDLAVNIEDSFSIEIEDEDIDKIKTVSDVVDLIIAKS